MNTLENLLLVVVSCLLTLVLTSSLGPNATQADDSLVDSRIRANEARIAECLTPKGRCVGGFIKWREPQAIPILIIRKGVLSDYEVDIATLTLLAPLFAEHMDRIVLVGDPAWAEVNQRYFGHRQRRE